MRRRHRARIVRSTIGPVVLVVLSGCATFNMDQSLERTREEIATITDSELILKRNSAESVHAQAIVDKLLEEPLTQANAIQLALANSAAFQVVLAQNWANGADAAQSGRIPNPIFNFERVSAGSELEIGRLLSFGLLDLVTLPKRQQMADSRLEMAQINLTNAVIEQVMSVRQAWVEAIGAQQNLGYARQVFESAEASAELAERMESVGNFSRLDRARQQTFYTDAASRVVASQHQMTAKREKLIRLLGLNDDELTQLSLPERLPDLPAEPLSADMISEVAIIERLDVKMADAAWRAAARAQGIGRFTSYTDIEIGARHDTRFADGESETGKGYEVDITLPLFDWGGLKRDAMNARTLAAGNQLDAVIGEAGSSLREAYSAYRTSYDLAKLYEDEILPLQELIAEETVLRYNGMLIGVFELLADSRRQISSVQAAIDANQQFWMADAALQASMIGKPTMATMASADTGMAESGGGH